MIRIPSNLAKIKNKTHPSISNPEIIYEVQYIKQTSMISFNPPESVILHSDLASRNRLTNQVQGIQNVLNSWDGTDEYISSSGLVMNPASIKWSLVGNRRFTGMLIDLKTSTRVRFRYRMSVRLSIRLVSSEPGT